MGHSCKKLLWVTLTGHSCGTLFWATLDTLVGHSCETLVGHSYGTLLWDTLVGHSYRTLFWDTLVGHSSETLFWDTLVGHSCGTILSDTLVGHSCGSLLRDTLVGHSHATLLWVTLLGHSCRTLLWDTLVGHSCGTLSGRASPHGTATSRTSCRHTICPHTAGVSYETFSKSHAYSLQNERFVRDFLKNSHVKVCKTSVSYETSSKSQAETPIGAHTHTSRSPAKQFRDSSPSTRSHANPNVTATVASTTTHRLAKALRLPRNVTSVTPRNFTIPCTCHENRTSAYPKTHKVLRLPRKVTIDNNRSCELQQNVHHTTRLE